MKKIMLILIYVALIPLVHATSLNEIFPNPQGDDNNKEYVEVYSQEWINLSGYVIGDEASNDTLIGVQYSNSSYSLIVEEGFDYTALNTSIYNPTSIYSVGATIGNNLGNSNDTVFFYSASGLLLDSFHYTSAPDGKSYERNSTDWYLSEARSPGYENTIAQNTSTVIVTPINDTTVNRTQLNRIKISSVVSETMYMTQHITKGFRIDNLQNEKVDVTLHSWLIFNETIWKNETRIFENISKYRTSGTADIEFFEHGNYTLCGEIESNAFEEDFSDNTLCTEFIIIDPLAISCDRGISIALNNSIVPNNKPISFTISINNDENIPYVVSYFIQEFNGNRAKEKQNTTNDNVKHWTPKIKKGYGLFTLYAEILEPGCNDTNPTNNIATQQIIVTNTFSEEGRISIDHIYLGTDGVAKTGDSIRSKITVYPGNLSRLSSKSIKAYAENEKNAIASEITTIALEENFQEIVLTVPVLLDYSCDSSPDKEQYTLIIEGINTKVKQKFPVSGVNKKQCTISGTGEYSTEFPTIAHNGDMITTSITIHNSDDTAHSYKTSSKIYRGPKTYTGDFFANQKQIELQQGKQQTVSLQNTIPEMTEGTYKIKVYVQKDDQKTMKEFTQDIHIIGNQSTVHEEYTPAKIISFFSLSSEPDQEIPVIAQVQGNGDYTLLLDTVTDRQNKTIFLNGTETIVLNVTLVHGKNMLMLSIISLDTIVESMPLILYADEEELTEIPANISIPEQNSAFEKITGNVILEPIQGQHASFVNTNMYISTFLGMLIVISSYAIYRKKHKLFKRTVLPAEYEECH